MKKGLFVGVLCAMLFGLAGCVDKEAKEEVKNYVETTSVSLKKQEQTMLVSYTSVIGENYTDDDTLCMELVLNTIPMATALRSEAENVAGAIAEVELAKVHASYVNYITEFEAALRLLLTAVDEQDKSISEEANMMLNNANTYATEFKTELQALKKKYRIE